MRWKGREQSENVKDSRGMAPAAAIGGGGILVLVIAGIAYLMGAPPEDVKKMLNNDKQKQVVDPSKVPGEDDHWGEFTRVVLKDTETVWAEQFKRSGRYGAYKEPVLELFSDRVNSACGTMSSKVGPFYCPADQKVYLDPTFFDELARRHKAPGDFAQAYVIAHEVAHHVQNLTGYSQKVNEVRRRGNEQASNQASVRLELQADYLAGVWAHHAQRKMKILQSDDIEEALNAAAAIGDDTLQRAATGHVDVRAFTHGSSKQRVKWFAKGMETGDFNGAAELFELRYDNL